MHKTTVKRSLNDPSEWVAVCACGAVMVAHSEEAAERAGHNHEHDPIAFAVGFQDDNWRGCCV